MSGPFTSIGIVGSGAIGCYYGGKLAHAGADVRFLMRGDLAAVRARGSVLVHEATGLSEARPVKAFGSAGEIGRVDLVVVALKTTSAALTRELVGPLLGERTAILTLQNGLGADEHLAGLFGAGRIMGGLVFMAANRTGPGEVRAFSPGLASVGEFGREPSERTRALADLLERSGIRAQVVPDLLEARWRKLVWNIPFNGLAVAENTTTDRLCAEPRLLAEVRALMGEVQTAARAFGFRIPDNYLERQVELTPPMGPYKPSSYVDYLAGREVEVEAIWGEPLRRAAAAGVAAPRLENLYGRLRAVCPKGAGSG